MASPPNVLANLRAPRGAESVETRIGRGRGSGIGKTSGKGQKGQRSRKGRVKKRGFEGGQMPLQRRLPKRGFYNLFRKVVAIVNVGDLDRFGAGAVVDETALRAAKLVQGVADRIKLLGDGEVTKALTVRVGAASPAAREKIERAGGKVETPTAAAAE